MNQLDAESASLGALLEPFVNRVSHPRGRVLDFLSKAKVTVDQAILLHHVQALPSSSSTALAAKMNLSLPSLSQMLDRLVKLGLVRRIADAADRRKKAIVATAKGKALLIKFRAVRTAEFELATQPLSPPVRHALACALRDALAELASQEAVQP